MSLFRSRAKILGQLSHRNITAPRSTSALSVKTCLNHSVAELPGIKNVGEIPEREGPKPQITLSRSLFSLFRKKGPNAQDDVTNTCSHEKGQESWLSKMLPKPPRPMTPQEKCMIKTREMQKKQEVGLVQIPCQDWKPSVTVVTIENRAPKSNLARSPVPPPTLQPVPPPSVETRLMELHEKHNTCVLHSEMEMDMHKYIPKLPYSEFKPRKKETPEQFCMEKYEDKRSATSDGDRRKPVSAHSHRRTDRKFSWYTQQSLERSEPAFANMQSNTALIHTGRKNIQYFTHRNYVEPQRRTKIRGNSLQTQVSKRKYILAHTQFKESPKVFPIVNNERKIDQFSPNLISGKKSNYSELPSLSFTAKSLTRIPKITMKSTFGTDIKPTNVDKISTNVKKSPKINKFMSIGEVGPHLQSIKSTEEETTKGISSKNESTTISTTKKANVYIKEAQKSHISYNSISKPQSDTSVHVRLATMKNSVPNYQTKENDEPDTHKTSNMVEKGQNKKLLYKLEFRRWMKRIKEKERTLGHNKIETKNFPESEHVPISSKTRVTHINNESMSKGIPRELSHQTQASANKNLPIKKFVLKESQTKLVQPHVKEVSIPSSEVHTLPLSSNLCSILPLPKKPLWETVISYTEAKANADVSLGKKRDYHEYSISQTHNQLANSLGTLQKLLSSQVKQSESLNRFRTKSKPNIKDTIIISDLLRNNLQFSKAEFTNMKQDLNTNNIESTISEKTLENHKTQVFDADIKENKSISEADNKTNEKDCELVQQTTATDNTSSNEVLLQTKCQHFTLKNDTSITNIYQQLTNDLQNIQSIQEKNTQSINELFNHHVTNNDSEEKKEFPLNKNDCTFGVCPNDTRTKPTKMLNFAHDILPKTEILISDVFHSRSRNLPENKNHQTSNLVTCLFSEGKGVSESQTTKLNEKLFSSNLEEDNTDQLGVTETNQKTSENNPPKGDSLFASPLDLEDSQTEWVRSDNVVQNCSSQTHSQPKFMYETIQAKSCNGLVPIETYNSLLNKNWTFADYAAYFYGAIFGKQDMLNMHLHKLMEPNDKEYQSSLLENALMNTSNTTINELKSDQISKSLKTECSYKQDNSMSTPEHNNNAEIKDEVLANGTSTIYTESSESTNKISNNDTIHKCSSEKKDETTNHEDTEHSSENTPNTVRHLSPSNSCTGSIQCCPTKRNYSSWSIQEPFNPNQSSYECKSRKKKKDSGKKGKKSKKDRIVPKQMICTQKVHEEAVKKIHLPGCKLPSASGCSDDRIEALPCIKKEAPAPSFSECLRYPIKKTKFTECDCHKKKYPKCKTGYVLPKNYDACRKKQARPKRKREKEEELEDVDEGQQPPCD